jgi:hypothetical protein
MSGTKDYIWMFIDFEKAFDSVSKDKIRKIMERFGLLQKILKLIRERWYRNYTCQVMHKGKVTEPIEIESGVRQRRVLTNSLFVGYRWSVEERY